MNANIDEEINKFLEEINKMGFKDKMNLNSSETARIIGVSPSSIENWRKCGLGITYIEVVGRIVYPKRYIAEFLALRQVKIM